jgi:glycosyltransferase involved in cell wall biosynthesis
MILFDAERMKYPNTGLYHYCLQVGKALLQSSVSASTDIFFYTPEHQLGIFGEREKYLPQRAWHKFYLPHANNFNLWHCTYQGTNYFPFKSKSKKVITVHDINFMYDSEKSSRRKQKYLYDLQSKIDAVDHVIVISKFVRDQLDAYGLIANKPLSIIHNGCNINSITQPQPPQSIPAADFLFTIGTIVDKKNFHVLPRLLVNNNLRLIIAGTEQSASYKQKIILEAKQYNVLDRVDFVGVISEPEKYWYYQHCKGFVFPSLAEGFGLPVIEAMHFGKPVFLSTATSLPEIGGDNAYYFNSFEIDRMQSVLVHGLVDFEINNKKVAVQQRASLFKWEHVAAAYGDIYLQLLADG